MTDEELRAIEQRAHEVRNMDDVRRHRDGDELTETLAADTLRLVAEVRRLRHDFGTAIAAAARALNSAVWVGNAAPAVRDLQAAMSGPKPGDFVVEVTTLGRLTRRGEGLGWLVEVTEEPAQGWEDPDEPAPLERVWYIDALDGVRRRWTNALFYAIPGLRRP